MYKEGEYVVYRQSGVFKIIGTVKKMFNRKENTYYQLVSVDNDNTTALVPIDSQDNLRRVINKEELDEVIEKMKLSHGLTNIDYHNLNTTLSNLINDTNIDNLITIIQTVYTISEQKKADNKPLGNQLQDKYKRAKKLLNQEIAISAGIDECDVDEYLEKRLEQ